MTVCGGSVEVFDYFDHDSLRLPGLSSQQFLDLSGPGRPRDELVRRQPVLDVIDLQTQSRLDSPHFRQMSPQSFVFVGDRCHCNLLVADANRLRFQHRRRFHSRRRLRLVRRCLVPSNLVVWNVLVAAGDHLFELFCQVSAQLVESRRYRLTRFRQFLVDDLPHCRHFRHVVYCEVAGSRMMSIVDSVFFRFAFELVVLLW